MALSKEARKVVNSVKPNLTSPPPGPTEKGSAGYDNIRDDIEKTKDLRELSLPFTKGSILFQGSKLIEEDNYNLFWDSANKRLEPNLIIIRSDGSQRHPALKFNDADTGFFKVGDSVRFSLNDSTKIIFDSTGLEVVGAIRSATATITASADSTNVSGINTLWVDTSGASVTLGGLAGGVNGQVLNIVISEIGNNLILAVATGTQPFVNHTSATETIDGGGAIYVCDGTHWHDASHAKHV